MAKASGPKTIFCYHCGHRLEVSFRTKSTPCPGCYKSLLVEDIVVKSYRGVINLETCGKLIVRKKGHAVAQNRIVAQEGIELDGRLRCIEALTGGEVWLSKRSEWKGDLKAGTLVVEEGAVIREGRFLVEGREREV
jgi:hypothetical protein